MFNKYFFIWALALSTFLSATLEKNLEIVDQFEYVLSHHSAIDGGQEIFENVCQEIGNDPQMNQKKLYCLLNRNYRLFQADHTDLTIVGEKRIAELPFIVRKVEGKYRICAITCWDDFYDTIPLYKSLFNPVGDEIISWNGRPIEDVVEERRQNYVGFHVNPDSGRLAACGNLTQRNSIEVDEKLIGCVNLILKKWYSSIPYSLQIRWSDASFKGVECGVLPEWDLDYFAKRFKSPLSKDVQKFLSEIPSLHVSIFQKDEHDVAYLRIKKFVEYKKEEVDQLLALVKYLENHTDGMILDLRNCAGGYEVSRITWLALLLEKPIELTSKKKVFLRGAVRSTSQHTSTFQEKFRVEYANFKRNNPYMRILYCRKPKTYAKPEPIVRAVAPVKNHYSKPIITLINESTASAGEVFAYCMQQSGRSKLFGEKTGYGINAVHSAEIPFYDKKLRIRFPVSKLAEGSEFYGVEPDIDCKLQKEDIMGQGMQPYLKALFSVLDELIK